MISVTSRKLWRYERNYHFISIRLKDLGGEIFQESFIEDKRKMVKGE